MKAKNKSGSSFWIRGVQFSPDVWVEFDPKSIPPAKLAIIEEKCDVQPSDSQTVPPHEISSDTPPILDVPRAATFARRTPKRKGSRVIE